MADHSPQTFKDYMNSNMHKVPARHSLTSITESLKETWNETASLKETRNEPSYF